jgi:tRNA A-37 threonylcarbamoyl transferase component Bud32/uncharacterized RDD family membrane protein YckC
MQFKETTTTIKQTCSVCNQIVTNDSSDCKCISDDTTASSSSSQCEAADEPVTAFTGDLGERYDVLSLIGRGGMASVYKIYDKTLGKVFAAKVMNEELAVEATARKRFAQEIEAASSMTHGNIAAVYSHGVTEKSLPFICMDYLEGETLASMIKREGKLEPRHAALIFQQVCEALTHAHMKGIIHRDITPGNIFINRNEDGVEVVKLVDFGLAKLEYRSTDSTKLTQTGALLGSPFYMSPEQCHGETQDARSDIYSLGCVMYHALTGHPPFDGDNSIKIVLQHVKQTAPAFATTDTSEPQLMKSFEACVLRCLQKNPQDRYQSIDEVTAQLQSLDYQKPNLAVTVAASPAPVRRIFASVVDAAILPFIAGCIGAIFLGNPFESLGQLSTHPAWQLACLSKYCHVIAPMASALNDFSCASILLVPAIFFSYVIYASFLQIFGFDSVLLFGLFPFIYFAYSVVCKASPLSSTLGQRILNLTIVDEQGKPLSFQRAVLHTLAEWIAPLLYLIELVGRPILKEHANPALNAWKVYWAVYKYLPLDGYTGAFLIRREANPIKIERKLYIRPLSLVELKRLRRTWNRSGWSYGAILAVVGILCWSVAPSFFMYCCGWILLFCLAVLPFVVLNYRIKRVEAQELRAQISKNAKTED